MNISFFEEFPTAKNLAKLRYVTWPTTIYVAAKSVKEFELIRDLIFRKFVAKKNAKKVMLGYWPVLSKEAGYWLSPFSDPQEMKRVMAELSSSKGNFPIMWDAELPLHRPWLFFHFGYYLQNFPRMRRFFRKNGSRILSSEYPIRNRWAEFLLQVLGVSHSPATYGNTKIIMYYTSMHPSIEPLFRPSLARLQKKYGDNLQVGLGVIATGINGNESLLSPPNLQRDLQDMARIGITEVVIFRLGGLNKKYAEILQRWVK